MTITDRDKRALIVLGAVAVIALGVYFWPQEAASTNVVGLSGSVDTAEHRLEQVRRLAAQVPGRQAQLDAITADVGRWEEGLIRQETGQQAQAQLLGILREIASSQDPPVEFASVEIGQIQPLGDSEDYGEVLVSVNFECGIEQLVNMLADLTHRPEAVATDEIRIAPKNEESKTIQVRLQVAGLVPRSLVPEQRGLGRF